VPDAESNSMIKSFWLDKQARLFFFQSIFGLCAILFSVGFGLKDSLTVSLFFLLTSFLGALAYVQLGKRETYSTLELFGVGISFGTIVPAISGFLLRTFFNIPSICGFVVLIALALSTVDRSRRNRTVAVVPSPELLASILPISAAAAFAEFNHTTYLFVLISVIGLFFCKKIENWLVSFHAISIKVTYFLIFSISACTTRLVDNQFQISSWRTIVGIDQIFDQSQAASIARYGFTDNFFVAGARMPGHTLTHAWAGIAQIITDSPVFMVSGAAGVLFGNLGVSALIGGIVYRWTKKISVVVASLLIWTFQASLIDQYHVAANPRVSNSISLLWFAFGWFLLIEFRENRIRRPMIFLPVLLAAIGFGKFHWIVYILATIGIVSIVDLIKTKSKQFIPLILLTALMFSFVYLVFMRGMNAYSEPVFKFFPYIFFGHVAVVLLRGFAFTDCQPNESSRTIKQATIFGSFVFIPLISITGGNNMEGYFFICSLVLISIYQGANLEIAWRELPHARPISRFVVPVVFISVLFFSLLRFVFFLRIQSSTKFPLLKFVIVDIPADLVVLILVFFFFFVTCFLSSRNTSTANPLTKRSAIAILVVLCFTANCASFISQTVRPYMPVYIYGKGGEVVPKLSDNEIQVGIWLNQNTEAEDIVATNNYCQIRVQVGHRTPIKPEDCRQQNMIAWISAIAHRRMLLEAPIISVLGPGSPLSEIDSDRYNLSLDFAQHPNHQLLTKLKSYGVSWFVFNNDWTPTTNWINFGVVEFKNDDYTVLRLA
jgi:hypothetical protein